MTPCREVLSGVHAYLDNELLPREALAYERHLMECAACRAQYERLCAVADAVRGARPLYEPSPGSYAAARALLLDAPRCPARAAMPLAGVATALCLVAVARVGIWTRPAETYGEFAARSHLDLARSAGDLDVVSAQPEVVADWLARRLRFRPGLPSRAPSPRDGESYNLVGARLIRFAGHDVAYVLYRMKGKPVSLLMTAATGRAQADGEVLRSGNLDFGFTSRNGLDLITWTDRGVDYCLVSEMGGRGAESCAVCHESATERRVFEALRPKS